MQETSEFKFDTKLNIRFLLKCNFQKLSGKKKIQRLKIFDPCTTDLEKNKFERFLRTKFAKTELLQKHTTCLDY